MNIARGAGLVFALVTAVGAARGSELFDQLKKDYREKAGVELVAGTEKFSVKTERDQIEGTYANAGDIDLFLYMFRKECTTSFFISSTSPRSVTSGTRNGRP